MDRRRALALLGSGLATVAGCIGIDAPGGSPDTVTETGVPTTTPDEARSPASPQSTTLQNNEPYRTPEGWTLRLTTFRPRRGIVEYGTVHPDPLVPEDRQFLQVGVDVEGDDAPAADELCLAAEIDGRRTDEGCTSRLEAVSGDRLGELHAVPVPLSIDTDAVAVAWRSNDGHEARWRVPSQIIDALGRLPEFVVEDLTVPESVEPDSEFEVEITVRNDGDRTDWFVAELGLAIASDGADLEIPVDVGERVTVPRTLFAHFGERERLDIYLHWGSGRLTRTVEMA